MTLGSATKNSLSSSFPVVLKVLQFQAPCFGLASVILQHWSAPLSTACDVDLPIVRPPTRVKSRSQAMLQMGILSANVKLI